MKTTTALLVLILSAVVLPFEQAMGAMFLACALFLYVSKSKRVYVGHLLMIFILGFFQLGLRLDYLDESSFTILILVVLLSPYFFLNTHEFGDAFLLSLFLALSLLVANFKSRDKVMLGEVEAIGYGYFLSKDGKVCFSPIDSLDGKTPHDYFCDYNLKQVNAILSLDELHGNSFVLRFHSADILEDSFLDIERTFLMKSINIPLESAGDWDLPSYKGLLFKYENMGYKKIRWRIDVGSDDQKLSPLSGSMASLIRLDRWDVYCVLAFFLSLAFGTAKVLRDVSGGELIKEIELLHQKIDSAELVKL